MFSFYIHSAAAFIGRDRSLLKKVDKSVIIANASAIGQQDLDKKSVSYKHIYQTEPIIVCLIASTLNTWTWQSWTERRHICSTNTYLTRKLDKRDLEIAAENWTNQIIIKQ